MVPNYHTFTNKNILRTNVKKRNNQNEGNNLHFVLFGDFYRATRCLDEKLQLLRLNDKQTSMQNIILSTNKIRIMK